MSNHIVMPLLTMKLKAPILSLVVLYACPSVLAQEQYSMPVCRSSSASGKVVGDRIKLHLPKGAIVQKGRSVNFSYYFVGFQAEKGRVWLQGLYGPKTKGGKAPEIWISHSVEVIRRRWKFANLEGDDVKGKEADGTYWRYLARDGEHVEYFGMPADAAAYFDGLLNNACFLDWRRPQHNGMQRTRRRRPSHRQRPVRAADAGR